MLDKVQHYRALDEIHAGLSKRKKRISPKYFYDERGSQLFDDITRLPEYYLTNAELTIMRKHVDEMTKLIGPRANIIELGAGSGLKTRILLGHVKEPAAYVPVDISAAHLEQTARALRGDFPDLDVMPVAADFSQPFDLPQTETPAVRNVVYFPGSTIGNFKNGDAMDLLEQVHSIASEGGGLLIGADLQKDVDVIERAYNDSAGVTAEFNLNMLRHLNEVYEADFDLDSFRHKAHYKESKGRIEMRLVSEREQTVNVGDRAFDFEKGEAILTEYSHKYTLEGFAAMAGVAGFSVKQVWLDPDKLFSVQYCVVV